MTLAMPLFGKKYLGGHVRIVPKNVYTKLEVCSFKPFWSYWHLTPKN